MSFLPLNWTDKKNSSLLADFIAKHGAEYCMTAEEINQMRDAVNEMAVIQQSVCLGTAEPTDTPAGTGSNYWEVITPGTYTKFGGVVLAANSRGLIYRNAAGAFSISQAALDLTEYALKYSIETYYDDVFRQFPLTYGYQNLSGGISGDGTDDAWVHTDFLRSKVGSTITYAGTGTPTNVFQVAFFDANFALISGVIGGANGSISVPSGTVWERFCAQVIASENSIITTTLLSEVKDSLESKVSISDINNTFVSTSEVVPASANSARVLNEKIIDLQANSLPAKNYKYDINHFIHYGQSLSQGDWQDEILSDTQKYNSLMFSGGIRTWEFTGSKYASLVPAVERRFWYIEKDELTVTNGATASGDITITLNGVAFNVAVTSGDTISQVISRINSGWATFVGWTVQDFTANSVVFRKNATGICSAPTFSGGSTGVTGSFIRLNIGGTVVGADSRGETPASGTADKLIELIQAEDGFDYTDQQYQILVSAPGMGGTGIVALSDQGGVYYTRLIADVTNGKSLADASGKSYGVPAISWIQGEQDTYSDMSQATYYSNMVTLFTNLNVDIKAITGQTEDVNFFLYQTACFDFYFGSKYTYPDVSLAQLQIANDLDHVHLATPVYHLPKLSDNVHFTSIGSKWFGGYFGIAYKRVIIDKKPFSCIKLISQSVVGNNIYLKFEAPVYPLKFDTTNVVDRGVSKGFQIRNVGDRAQNSFLNIITNVEINKYNTIKITCSSSPAGKKLTYAINGTGLSDASSGNLRDSQDIKFLFKNAIADGAETSHDMYNWCPLFETIL